MQADNAQSAMTPTFMFQQKVQQKGLQQKQQQKQQQKALQQKVIQQKILQQAALSKSFKAKCGIFFGYNGQSFLGMQYQRATQNTIQNIIHKVLCQGGFILKSNQDQLKRINWSRAARTDKKVHALVNGISLKLEIGQQFVDKQATRDINFQKIRNYINAELPLDIRVFCVRRVTKNFDMRHDALTRVYNYIIPTCIFQNYEKFKTGSIPDQTEQAAIIQKLNILCKLYLGTHTYSNFTKGYKKQDPRCQRYMISMKAQKVQSQVFDRYYNLHKQLELARVKSSQKYLRFTLVGQSFIYHQIRKMIGLLIKIFAQNLDGEVTIRTAFKLEKFQPYLAPGEGLYLNRMTFQNYNRKKIRNKEPTVQLNQDQEQRVLQFREYLQCQILNHQIQAKVFTKWLINRFDCQIDEEIGSQPQNQEPQEQEQPRENQNQDQKQGKQQNEKDKKPKPYNKGNKWKNNKRN